MLDLTLNARTKQPQRYLEDHSPNSLHQCTEPCSNVPSTKYIHPSPNLKQQRKENHKVIVTTAMQADGTIRCGYA